MGLAEWHIWGNKTALKKTWGAPQTDVPVLKAGCRGPHVGYIISQFYIYFNFKNYDKYRDKGLT